MTDHAILIADRITAELTQVRHERDEALATIERMRVALQPLANLAIAIDGHCGSKRSDNSTVWQGNAMQRGPFDLTMGHARAARAALAECDAPDWQQQASNARACHDAETIAACETDGTALSECVKCGMFVRADQVDHPVFGFKARCEK